jgi:ATP-dependent Clp protease adapter protein ClpS
MELLDCNLYKAKHNFNTLIFFIYFLTFVMQTEVIKTPGKEIIEEIIDDTGTLSRVVLFNDDEHTFDEVIAQLIKALNCNFEIARDYAFEAHEKGKAVVFSGSMKDCLRVSSILEEIALNTQILS